MDTLMNDVRYALRSLGKAKLFTAVALTSLALGIGANVTVFSLLNSLAFRPLPYADPGRLVDLHEFSATKLCGGCGTGTSYPGFIDWRDNARSFAQMGAYMERPFAVSGTETAERVGGAIVSAETFGLLGIHPVLGRDFTAEDDIVGAAPVVLLGDALFTRRYGGDRRIVGQTIRVNGTAHIVIGVMPPRFRFPEYADLWVPFVPNAAGSPRDQRDFGVVARLKPGVSVEKANGEMRAIAKSLEEKYPESQKEWTAEAAPFRFASNATEVSLYGVLLGAVGFVLLIVCANLAGLLLARGAKRQREIAIRLALGATRAQIIRHLLTESVILSLAGGALGLLVAWWSVDIAVKAIGTQAPFYIVFGLDAVSLAFSIAISVMTGVLFGLLPALRASAPDVHSTLKESSVTVKKSAVRGLLVVGQLALAMVLLAGAGVLMKSFLRISAPERGYDARNLLTGNFEFLDVKYRNSVLLRVTQKQIVERFAQIPGVTAAALDRMEFVAGFGNGDQLIQAEGVRTMPAEASPRFYHVVSPGYFATVQLPVVAGRAFGEQDRAGAERVVMITKHMGDVLWPGASPLGRRIKLGPADSLPWLTVVGVVADVRGSDAGGTQIRNYAYVPTDQAPGDRATLLLRTQSDPLRLIPSVRAAVRAVDADLPVLALQTVAQQQHDNFWPYQMYALAMAVFAAFAILLAAIGLYGVIAYNTAQRTREIGVRMALGAEAKHVISLVASEGGRLVVVGIVIGALGSSLLLRALSAMLFGASPVDLPIYTAVAALLAAVAFAAIWVPARRASRIDPLEALRAE